MKDLELDKTKHSKLTFLSFSSYDFASYFVGAAQFLFLFFYYEAIIGLNAWLISLSLALAFIWDALNNPLIGYLTDRNTRFTKKWGKRLPWILIGILPWLFFVFLIYLPPDVDPNTMSGAWILSGWLAITLSLADTFESLIYVNQGHLRADKFRSESERRTLAAYSTPISIISRVLGMLIPPLIISIQVGKEGFVFMALFICIIGLIACLLFIPGAKEEKAVIERYNTDEPKEMGFFEALKKSLMFRSFIVFIVGYTAFVVATEMLTMNVIYIGIYVLREDPSITTLILGFFLLGAIISVPFWVKLSRKIDSNKKTITIGGFCLAFALIPLTFFQTIYDLLIFTFILGFSIGCWWALFFPVIQTNVIDDFKVKTKMNQKGILIGLTTFISRLTATLTVVLFALVHDLTGFVPGYDTYEGLASAVEDINLVLWGIRLLMGVIPMIIVLTATIIFWKFYPLSQDVVKKNKIKLEELGI
ncbi:MAG: MFS transporter [Candidatus Lokiarchaeota archaeon]|nr:MFS transporter [Candidatus Lokiarchaeota archaeon]MBD3339376.1 MFS transporter [Candidatus Lokiarchaeota archaeon]